MPLPQAVQAQVDEANRLSQEIYKAVHNESETEDTNIPEGVAATPSERDEDAQQASVVEESVQEPSQPVEAVERQPEPSDENDPNSETYEQRWRTLQGTWNAERRKNEQLLGRIESLESMLANLASRQPEQQAEPEPSQPPQRITAKDYEEYGEELIDLISRAAKQQISSEIDELRNENAELKRLIGTVGQRQEMSAQEKVYALLATEVGTNWQQINSDQRFLEWLSQLDPFAGKPRMDLLQEAFRTSDAPRVVHFFKAFLSEQAAVSKATQKTSSQQAAQKKVPLESLASPGVGSPSSSADTPQDESRIWMESEIAAFYADVQKGRFRTRPDERARIEQQIIDAANAGMVRAG